jgi:hypothetical protein
MKLQRPTAPAWAQVLVLSIALALSLPSLAAPAWLGVPSAANGARIVVVGGSLQPWQAITVRVTDPSGQQSTQSATADANGALSLQIVAGPTGLHKVTAYDLNGKVIGQGDCLVSR